MLTDFRTGQFTHASRVLTTVAQDLIQKGQALWQLEHFTPEALEGELTGDTLITGYISKKPVAVMVLVFHDPLFWPNIEPDESSFVHKLAVLPKYRGQGLAAEMLEYAATQTLAKDIHVTRLDCVANRHRLRAFYKSVGYSEVGFRQLGAHRAALFEKYL